MLSTKDIVLLLLSSVLVTSEEKRDEERQNSGAEKESDEIGEAVMISGDTSGASHPQFTKQLDAKWTFWYESKPKRNKDKPMNKIDYLKEVKRGKSFDTIASFWDCWREVQAVCNPSMGDCNYELFKHGIKPVWEDPKNIKGGKCVVSTPLRTTSDETMKKWVSLMITLLIGEFGPDVNGVVLSRRAWGNIFAVWVRNANDKDAVDAVMKHLHEIFGQETQIRFQRHQASMRKKLPNTQPIQLGTKNQIPEKRRLSESEGSSSEGEQREKNKGKEQPRMNSMINLGGERTGPQLHPPVPRTEMQADRVASHFTPGETGASKLNVEESTLMERVPSSYVPKRRPSINASQTKPTTTRKDLPKLTDLSSKDIAMALAILLFAVAISILSWRYL